MTDIFSAVCYKINLSLGKWSNSSEILW